MRHQNAALGLLGCVFAIELVSATSPDPAGVSQDDFPGRLRLANGILAIEVNLEGPVPLLERVSSLQNGEVCPVAHVPLFAVETKQGSEWKPLALRKRTVGKLKYIPPDAHALRREDRYPGRRFEIEFEVSGTGQAATWWIELRDSSYYVATGVVWPTQLNRERYRLVLFSTPWPGAVVMGQVSGSPVVAHRWFLGIEHPLADNSITGETILCSIEPRPIPGRSALIYSFALGYSLTGNLRRDFLEYVEKRRARPFALFVNYNSWWDIATSGKQMTEAECLAVIECFGEELTRRRGMRLDSFVFDDGWDDPQTLWGFHEGFPQGFTPLTVKAREYQSSVGTWLSPFGGYGAAKQKRVAFGQQQGYEVTDYGFSLAGDKYFARFREICTNMITKYDVNYFKFDGIAGNNASGAGEKFAADVEALLRLCEDLRAIKPDLYLSITTGTWPSPYWLWFGDSVWRNGDDCGVAGWGTPRQRWITYRDGTVKRMIVDRAPLYPLNSLMTIPVCYARLGLVARLGVDAQSSPDEEDLHDEMWMGFASGTQLAELYVTPQLLSPRSWDHLAECIRWARENNETLVDVHWVGGDPLKGEIYGYAAWKSTKGILILRNPADERREITLRPSEIWELSSQVARRVSLRCQYAHRAEPQSPTLSLDESWHLSLPPWGILLWEAQAESDNTID